jgi:hypothetical protein
MSTKVIASAAFMLRASLQDSVPSPFDNDEYYARLYQRVIEIQAEQCEAINSLYREGLFRPGYAVLRSVLEAMATLLWVSTNIERYCPLFELGKQPNPREILKRIGWEEEYERTFRYLSGFVHIDMENAEFYRDYLLGPDPSQPFPEILPDAELYIIETEEGPRPLAINLMSREEAERQYGPYLAAKTFDLVAAGLEKLYGTEYYRKDWWQQKAALLYTQLIAEHPELAQKMFWSIQQKLF